MWETNLIVAFIGVSLGLHTGLVALTLEMGSDCSPVKSGSILFVCLVVSAGYYGQQCCSSAISSSRNNYDTSRGENFLR